MFIRDACAADVELIRALLVEHVVGKGSDVTWVLRAGRDGAAAFFEKLGFSVSSIAMERTRGHPEA